MRMSELLNEVRRFELDEGFSPREIKMAIGIASDPRYAKGNMTGAVNAIEKMKRGLSKHPQVMAVLKRQNEDVDLDEAKMTTDITNDKKIFKDIEKMGVKVKNITPLSGNEKNSATITMVGTKNNINKVVDKYQMKHMMGVQDFDEDIDEAVSPAQQAAIAISKKEKGEKPKEEGNTFGKELKAARDKGEKTFVVSGKKYNVEDYDIDEASKEGTIKIIKTKDGKFQIQKMTKGKFVDIGKPHNSAKEAEKFRSGQPDLFGEASRIVEPYRPEFGLDEISTFSRAHIAILKKTFDPMRNKKLGPKGQAKLSKIMDMIGDKKDALIDLFKADIPFVSQSAAAKLITKYNMKGDEINKLKEEVELDEAMYHHVLKGKVVASGSKSDMMKLVKKNGATVHKGADSNYILNSPGAKVGDIKEETLDEKYDLYHKDFSSAMQHAYSYAKSKMGITVDPKEIDSKVATGPKKPTEGKTNKYMLKGKGGNLQIQVYNKGGSKPFELNMYKEGTDPLVSLYADQITLNAIKEK